MTAELVARIASAIAQIDDLLDLARIALVELQAAERNDDETTDRA